MSVRIHQHVNPLSIKYQNPITPPDWGQIYANLNLPLHLDIGCGRGRFLAKMAPLYPDWNFLGLEIREPLVHEANKIRDEQGLHNLHYLFANATNSLAVILASLPTGILHRVTIQFPDPWFKKRHHKRRMIQPELVSELAKYVVQGGEVFIQSDVLAVATEIRSRFCENSLFQLQYQDWFMANPLPIETERERATLNKGLPVYRALFILVS